jgi:signal transduction histidine kinase
MHSYKYQSVIEFIAVLCVMVGALVIAGWIFNSFLIITLFRGYAPMKFNTALCLVFSGSALLFFFRKGKINGVLHKIFSFAIIFIAGSSVFGNIFNFNLFAFEKIFSNDITAHFTANHHSGNMSLANSVCFAVIGVTCFTLRIKRRWVQYFMQWCLFIVTVISVVTIMGHIYKIPSFYKMTFLGSMAMHTAFALFLLSIASSLAHPSLGITGIFTGENIGNVMARRLFPMIAFLLLGVTYLRLQVYRLGLLNMDFATILFTTGVVLIVLLLIWRTAVQLNKIDIKRKTAEDSIVVLNDNIEQKIEHRTITLKEALQELEKSRQELNEALKKEKELNEIKSKFVSLASHEFRTPLSTILSSASLIPSYENEEGQHNREKHVERITSSVMHLNGLLEDFLSLGKLEAGRESPVTLQFNLKEFFGDMMEEMKMRLKPGQTIQLKREGVDDFATDKRLLKNILLNILSNAIKFSPDNSDITMKVNNTKKELLISVADNGIGIPEEDRQYLFSSFYRGKNASDVQGTGLGLHIVKRYVDILNGNINLQSELKKGTTINIELPQLQKEVA